jgi:glycosyltransferase involved in cell wall biosynthesis
MRKNILILGHDYVTQFVDIYNQYTRIFDKEKYEVTVAYLTGVPNEEIRQRTLAEQVVFFNLPKKHIRGLKIKAIRKLLPFTREKKFELVICHRYKPSYIMMWIAKFYPIPAIISVMHELHTMSSLQRQLVIACLARKNVLFAGVSNAVRDDMRNDLWPVPKERIVTLYNMIDSDLTEPQFLSREKARAVLQLPDDAFIFGTLGRLVRNKDQTTLIAAFSQIKQKCPKAKLIIIGSGELEQALKQQAKVSGLNDDIIFTGFLAHGFRYMKAFDCFVLPSIQEAFGRVLLEAMLARLAVIATHVHGIPEVIRDAGVLVKPKDPASLAAAMQSIYDLSQKERDDCGEKAYQHLMNHFSLAHFHEQFWQEITPAYLNFLSVI